MVFTHRGVIGKHVFSAGHLHGEMFRGIAVRMDERSSMYLWVRWDGSDQDVPVAVYNMENAETEVWTEEDNGVPEKYKQQQARASKKN